jgi:hypothetical protein
MGMQYQVPQFIEIEDKIFGPLTLKQFLYLAGGGGLCLLFFTLLPLFIAISCMVPVVAFSLALAFYKVNDSPFIVVIEHAFGYFFGHKLYLWKQRDAKPQQIAQVASNATITTMGVPKLSSSRLKDLSWSLNIKDRTASGVIDPTRKNFEI